MTRKEAISAKLKWYTTGKPCKYGHFSKRSTIDGYCNECRIVNQKLERAKVREFLNAPTK